jgi:DNA mismatch endonuclease (patch repair protein)
MVIVQAQIAVFVDGCFWHSCPIHGTYPKANGAWWRAKLAANRERDVSIDRALREAGWLVLRFWEHEQMDAAARDVARTVAERSTAHRQASEEQS